ncbi:MAG: TRAFAC clade GTPase domain-containing protein [Trebonia sp.]
MNGNQQDYYYTYPVAVALGCAIALGVALFAVALVRALVNDPDLIVPSVDQAEQKAARPVDPGEFAPDLAWPLYPFRQSRADMARSRRNVAAGNAAVWARPARWFFCDAKGWWVLFPIPAVIVSFLTLASVTSWCCYLVYSLVTAVSAGAGRAVLGPAAALLRATERIRRSWLRTDAACMRCFHVTPWPAYQCPTCLRPHHDVRPGRLGVIFRRCTCGTHLPVRASRAAWRVTPVCKRCEASLPAGAGAVRDIRVPVFGDISAGKTRFLYASLNSLVATANEARLDVTFPDQDSREQAEFGLGVIRSRRETAKTSTNGQVSLTVRLGAGRASELVHLFDAAGEHFRSARQPDALRFLDDGQGLVYVLDPFSIDAVRKRLGGSRAPEVLAARAAAGDPQLTYDEVASRLRDTGVPASTGRLAVVVSKADLLRRAGLELPADSDAIAQWLWHHDVHNLVMSARRDFADVRFFAVASQAMPPGGPDDPGRPLRWLLTTHGVRLPADPDVPAGGPGTGDRTGGGNRGSSGSGDGHAQADKHAGAQS